MSSRRAIQLFTPAARLTCPPVLPLLPFLSHTRTISHKAGRRRLAQRAVLERPKAAVHERGGDFSRELLVFRGHVATGDELAAMKLYKLLIAHPILNANDAFELARLLHNQFRKLQYLDGEIAKEAAKDRILSYVQTLIEDLKRRKIPPHPMASLHILSYCKDSQQFDIGVDFWQWILLQDHGFMDARTYGAGIELLAYYGKPLHYLESLYIQSLKQYPGAFSEYHLSPQAIVKDPSRPSNTPGSRLLLLQGILTARSIHGDWRNAYLALDTAMRLYPDQVPSRFYELFIYKRPDKESFHVFNVACRSGRPPSPRTFTHLLTKLAAAQLYRQSVLYRIHILKCMLTSLQAYYGAGGKVTVWHLNKIIQGLLQILPALSSPAGADAYEPLHQIIRSATKLLIVTLSKLGTQANTSTFNVIISMGGKLKRPDLVTSALKDLHEAGLEPNVLTRRCLLVAAGRIGDAKGVEVAWHSIIESTAETNSNLDLELVGTQIDAVDWLELVKAGNRTRNGAFVKEQFLKYKGQLLHHAILEEESRQTQVDVDPAEGTNVAHEGVKDASDGLQVPPMDSLSTIMRDFDGIIDRLNEIQNLVNASKAYNFYDSPLPMTTSLVPQPFDEIPDLEYRDLYEALSTDIGFTKAKGKETVPIQTPTGFTLAELRYQNWKAINQLLVVSEYYENEKASRVDQLVKARNPLPRHVWRGDGCWDGEFKTPEATLDGDSEKPAWVAQILKLRGLDVEPKRAA